MPHNINGHLLRIRVVKLQISVAVKETCKLEAHTTALRTAILRLFSMSFCEFVEQLNENISLQECYRHRGPQWKRLQTLYEFQIVDVLLYGGCE